MHNLTLKQLRYFDVLHQHGHFGRAAQACAISQPALSMQIKELEETLGVVLFERNARQVRLTRFGEVFSLKAKEILCNVEELGDLINAMQEEWVGQLRIGIIPTIAPYLLPQVLASLQRGRPSLDIHVRETQTHKLVEELCSGRLDLAIVALPISEPSLFEMPLFEENFVLVRTRSEEEHPPIALENLNEKKLLLLEEGHCFRDQALSFCNLQSGPPREVMEGTSLSTLVQMVSAGIGVTLLPEMAIPVETRSANVVVDRFDNPQPTRSVGLVWRKSNPLTNQLMAIGQSIKDAIITKNQE